MILAAVRRVLRDRGVMGLNARNGLYIAPHNARRHYPVVDNKLLTKRLAVRANIPTPPLYAVIEAHHQLRKLRELLAGRQAFVVKPARGAAGNGILLITACDRERLTRPSGETLTWEALTHHVASILSGIHSLEGLEDQAMIEALIQVDPVFEAVTYRGVPDIRIIVYRGVPVMGMVRLPTRRSDGRANLHQGAIGAGIALATGITGTAVQGRMVVSHHPDTGQPVSGIRVPHWPRILEIAALGYDMTGLGYVGADLVIDRELGPVLLELNARPGLAIQLANQDGLLRRLRLIDPVWRPGLSVHERVALARTLSS